MATDPTILLVPGMDADRPGYVRDRVTETAYHGHPAHAMFPVTTTTRNDHGE